MGLRGLGPVHYCVTFTAKLGLEIHGGLCTMGCCSRGCWLWWEIPRLLRDELGALL